MFRPCILVPTFDNPATVRKVVLDVRRHVEDVVVVDDGSSEAGRAAVEAIGRDALARTVRRPKNGGKGAAVKTGFLAARDFGYSHAVQVDADGQHTLDDLPRFVETARDNPDALVLGCPVFDASAPKSRLIGRRITQFWSSVETFGRVIADPMCGFRVYPLVSAIASGARGNAMDFDPEIAVRMVWAGVRVINLPTRVRYVSREDGGVSHFRMFEDNALISWMHTRMVLGALLRLPLFLFRRRLPQ
ncbi:MAG: glycosyltransferase family 2 protein [Polyangiaceae bacterium]|nr:glycosyltransferase family 2 protein [Polyangiaceae bacterium]